MITTTLCSTILITSLAVGSGFSQRGWRTRESNKSHHDLAQGVQLILSLGSNHGDYEAKSSLQTMVQKLLQEMTLFFSGMVDSTTDDTKRFYYMCLPQEGRRNHHHMPIRDLAAAWDATKLLQYWRVFNGSVHDEMAPNTQILEDAVYDTLQFYAASMKDVSTEKEQQVKILNPTILKEPSNIAHSALFLLAACGAVRLSILDSRLDSDNILVSLDGLLLGIMSMQQSDGAFLPEFGNKANDVYQSIEFLPGEAMVALMDVYELDSCGCDLALQPTTRNSILPTMERASIFYSNLYYTQDMDTNFSIWQIQAFSRLFFWKYDNSQIDRKLADLVLDMSRDIVSSNAWKFELSRGTSFYPNLNTIEIACGLDAIADGAKVALLSGEEEPYSLCMQNIRNAICFLEWSQDRVRSDREIGRGGLGDGGVQIFEQRLDVTGHAVSALTKVLSNRQCRCLD
jgi:hypothetical protein